MAVTPEDAVERSVNSLQQVYAVVIALAIGQAVQTGLRDPTGSLVKSMADFLPAIPGLLAFLVTMVPFFQGMNRHLDHCYLERREKPVRGALLFDFSVFFFESGFLFAAAWSVRGTGSVFSYLGCLLFLDAIWGWGSHVIHYRGGWSSVSRWALINLVAIFIGFLFDLLFRSEPGFRVWSLTGVAIARTVFDYGFCWDFYFPDAQPATEADAASTDP